MSRNKTVLILLVCLCIFWPSALSESPNLSAVEDIRSDDVSYKTAEAELGAYERFTSMQASEYYPVEAALSYDGGDAKFVEYTVKRNDMVKAGDVLAVFAVETDEVALAGLRMELEQLEGDYASGKLDRAEEIGELTEQMRTEADQYAREVLALRIARAETALEQYVYQMETAVAEAKKAIVKMEAEAAECTLTAPFDGMISTTYYLHEGDRVPVGETLITMQRVDRMLLLVNNSQGDFRYGMEVKIQAGQAKERMEYTGRVVGADTQLPASRRSGYAFVEINGWDGEKVVNPSVSAAACRLENIVLVPRRAIRLDSGKHLVYKMEDGALHRRYVNFVMQNSSHAWVIQGIEPGETIIID